MSQLVKDNTGLLLIDIQGKLAEQMVDSAGLFSSLRTLIAGAKLMQLPVIWVEQLPEKLGPTHDEIKDLIPGSALAKNTFSAVKNADIADAINASGCQHWLVAGIEAHICVYQTVVDLLQQDYQPHIITDAVSARTAANRKLALEKMQAAGAQLSSVEMALFELQQVASGEEFRQLIKLVK